MAGHVGLSVWVKLKPPANSIIYGTVQDLVPNSHLTLRDVSSPHSATRLDQFTIQASAIENLEVIEQQPADQPNAPPAHHAAAAAPPASTAVPLPRHVSASLPSDLAQSSPQRQPPAFVDPAIVSLGSGSPAPSRIPPKQIEAEAPVTPIKAMLARAAQRLPSPASPFIGEAGLSNVTQKLAAAAITPARSSQPQAAPTQEPVEMAAQEPDVTPQNTKRKIRRGGADRIKKSVEPAQPIEAPPVMNIEVSRNGNDMNGTVRRGKGWRNTPLLQPLPQAASPAAKANGKKNKKKRQEDQEFAQGDTTDIPEADFDFESELMKFDKKQVFDEIRQGDTTADEDLLVTHNRARPGTFGGKNLHPTEPILSPKIASKPDSHSNGLDSSSDADTELNFPNGRSSSRHSVSRNVLGKRQPSRSNSGQVETKTPHPLAAFISSDRVLTRPSISIAQKGKSASSLAASSPRPDRIPSPQASVDSAAHVTSGPAAAHFAIEPHMIPCPTLLPQALDTLEAAAVSTYGLTHEAFTEAAGIHIAEAALTLLNTDHGPRRPSRTNTSRSNAGLTPIPTTSTTIATPIPADHSVVVVLAGHHLPGARALAAARHLLYRNPNLHLIITEPSSSSTTHNPSHPDPDPHQLHAKAQSTTIRRLSRAHPTRIQRGSWRKTSTYIRQLPGPPALILDALLAGSIPDQHHDLREIIDWANRSRAPVLSIACPTGVSGVDGTATVVDGEPLAIRPERVLALGVPMTGLVRAVEMGERWSVGLVDLGINVALRPEEAVPFGAGWAVELRFVEEVLAE